MQRLRILDLKIDLHQIIAGVRNDKQNRHWYQKW